MQIRARAARVTRRLRRVRNAWLLLFLSSLASTAYGATYNNQRVTTAAPPATGCVVPPAVSSFLTTDNTIYLYFEAAVTTSDNLTNDWLGPNGTKVAGGSWDPGSGNYCFTGASLNIANTPANLLGSWQARVFDNGTLLFSVSFTINPQGNTGPSTLTVSNMETTSALITNSSGNADFCATPILKTAFQTTDASVGVWFTFDKGQLGDVLTINWIHPSGAIDSYQPSATLNFTGSGCYAWFLSINGQQPSKEPGAWQVSALVNGFTVFTLPFTIGSTPPTGPISITSVSTTSPVPMTPITIGTSGFNGTGPLQVRFSNSLGYTVTEQMIRMNPDGSIVAAVPYYVDPRSQQPGPGQVNMAVGQGGQFTSSVALSIQDLPPLSSYGTKLGEISHAFLVLQAMLIAQRINGLQALQAVPGSTVDTTQARSTWTSLLNAVIQARSDVDRVAAKPSLVIPGGVLPDGTRMQFDQTSLDFMDRVSAVFLSQTIVPLTASLSTSQPAPRLLQVAPRLYRHPRQGLLYRFSNLVAAPQLGPDLAASPQASPAATSTWQKILTFIEGQKSINELTTAGIKSGSDHWEDQVEAAAGAAGVVIAQAPQMKNAKLLGLAGAIVGEFNTVGQTFAQLAAYADGLATGNQALVDEAVQEMDKSQGKAISAGINLVLALTGQVEALESASTVAGMVKSFYDLGEAQIEATEAQQKLAEQHSDSTGNNVPQIGEVTGNARVSNGNGDSAAQSGLELQVGDVTLDTLADPDGNYEILVPLGLPSRDYLNDTLTIYDPETDDFLGSIDVNLNGLSVSNPLQLPPVSGSCVDDDASDPDGDDPDCDNN